jgi:crotonobetainyl-CoA:carnitine CoA-transferase CaiB-like acyl-CoA transferase
MSDNNGHPDRPDPVPGAMAGIRVLDFTRFQQGPYATRLLADLGAHVLKIERPGGEWDRRLRVAPDGFCGFFYGLNRGKHSVAIDITTAEGREIVLRLAAAADVVVENFRPGVMDRLGLGYDDLRAVNDQIIFAAGTGYGPHGPSSGEPMYDMVGQAVSGVSDFNRSVDGTPRLATRGYADAAGGVFLALGVLAALYTRATRGIGQRVDASLVGACLGLHTPEITLSLHQRTLFRPQRRVTSTSGAFRCRDERWLVIAATDQKLWSNLCAALGRPDLHADQRFAYGAIRERHRDLLEPIVEEVFLGRDRDGWITIMKAHGVPVGPVNTFLDLGDDPDALANGYILVQDDPRWGERKVVGNPFHLSRTPARVGNWTPELGEDTRTELGRAGYSPGEVDRLLSRKIIEAFPASTDDAEAGSG